MVGSDRKGVVNDLCALCVVIKVSADGEGGVGEEAAVVGLLRLAVVVAIDIAAHIRVTSLSLGLLLLLGALAALAALLRHRRVVRHLSRLSAHQQLRKGAAVANNRVAAAEDGAQKGRNRANDCTVLQTREGTTINNVAVACVGGDDGGAAGNDGLNGGEG